MLHGRQGSSLREQVKRNRAEVFNAIFMLNPLKHDRIQSDEISADTLTALQ